MLKTEAPALLPVYASMPVRPVRGHGSWLVDADGDEWLDAYGGHAVASTGHSHPDVVRAIAEQAEQLLFYSTAVPLPQREALAEKLAQLCPEPLGRVFLCNSGAEANENALHLARRHTGRQTIVTLRGGWHGRTVATLACTDGSRYEEAARRAGMPLSRKVAFDYVAALDAAVDDTVAAILIEPVQGFAGARDCSPEFLEAARRFADERGAVLLFDEVQCGVGRCGAFSAAEAVGVTPDALTFAKGLAGGLPIGAVVTSPKLTDSLVLGDLGSTFGGGPVPCAAALANIAVIERDGLIENAVTVGGHLARGAKALGVRQVSGEDTLLGLHLGRPAAEVQRALFGRRILTGTATDPQVLRLLPPLSFSRREADLLLAGLEEVLGVTKRDLLALEDWSPDAVEGLLQLAARVKRGEITGGLEKKVLAMVFMDPSLRTRTSFETAMFLHGGHGVVLEPGKGSWPLETELGAVMDGDTVEHIVDAARVLGRYADALGVRSFPRGRDWAVARQDAIVRNFARYCEKPVINLERARRHPCQALADAMTLREKLGQTEGKRFVLTWAWHPKALPTAVPASAALAAAGLGMEIVIARPPGYELDPEDTALIRRVAQERGGEFVHIIDDPDDALVGADAVYVKSWGAVKLYGRPEEEAELRAGLRDWRLTPNRLRSTRGGKGIVMHCLPVRRNVEIDDAVLDGPNSVVVDQAENRLHAQRALLLELIGHGDRTTR